MIRKGLAVVAALIVLRIAYTAIVDGPVGVGIVLGWLVFLWVLWRALPACREDVRRLLAFRARRGGKGGF